MGKKGIYISSFVGHGLISEEGDPELGTAGAAGLASSETLDDGTGEKAAAAAVGEDGMETVRLDGDANDGAVPLKPHPLVTFISAARRNIFVTLTAICFLIVLIIIISIACAGPRPLTSQPLKDGKWVEAATSCGPVQGVLEDGGFAFRGIPYAVPPVNNFRWSAAQPIHRIEHCWNGTFLAHNSSASCWQRDISGRIEGDEDCLYLDLYTPEVRYDTPVPVVVMIGAETLSGGSPGAMQPSAKLAHVRDMVFVRPNFRLGVFGFLAAEPLSRAAHLPTSGNYGISDIIAVLKWVQLNIQHFGGDKNAVTVWGHRAGGTLVTTLLGSRQAKPLFKRAWISSSSAVLPTKQLNHAEKLAEPFLQSIKCQDVSCLRSKSAEEIMDAVPSHWYAPDFNLPEPREATPADSKHEWLVIDGAIIQEDIRHTWTRNRTALVVMGTTAQVGTPARFRGANVTVESSRIEKIVKESLLGTNGVADEALRRYNATLKGLASMISDIRVICPLLNFTETTPFYITQSRGDAIADADSDVAAILSAYMATTPEEKRHVSAIQQLFYHFAWHGKIMDAAIKPGHRIISVGQDLIPEVDHPNCDFWMKKNIVPKYARYD
ncbi:neurotactin isoform X2 [Venturia canescens]|uniref:neurotactin isoform X2 n=1 Tax=Venturia canescens TaxID=32260 RepID=UPI001C9CD74E|nr:neurotactin isoform X2 [Venturia canescens]